MRALVTGAAGFIGSTLVDRLLADGHQVAQVSALNACAAAASNDYGEFAGAQAATVGAAGAAATSQLSNQQGAHVVISGCSFKPIREVPGGLENAPTLVEQAPDTPQPTPQPCQPQPWCERIAQLPNAPVLVPSG